MVAGAGDGGRAELRLLVLANSYPTAAVPSAAAYLTNRLGALARRDDVETVAVALAPTYSPALARARRLTGLPGADSLALDPGAGALLREARVRWTPADVAAGRLGRAPAGAIGRATRAVSEVLGAWCPDVVLAHGMYTLPAGEVARRLARQAGVPYVVGMHGSDVTQVIARAPHAARATLAGAAATIYVSAALRDRALGLGLPRRGAHVVPNGVDTGTFAPEAPRTATDPNAPRLLFVGNLLPVKGADRLPAIVSAVRTLAPGARLDVVGDGPLRCRLAAELGDAATLHGRLAAQEVARHMRRCDVLLVPSRQEGWGCVASEALACGTPVVATAVGGLPEAVGDPARLVPEGPGYVDDFARRVVRSVGAGVGAAPVARSWDQVVEAELSVTSAALGCSTGPGPFGGADRATP